MRIVYFAPEGFDYSSSQITEGLYRIASDGFIDFYCTNVVKHHGAMVDGLATVSEEEAFDLVPSADIVLVSSGGDLSFLEGVRGRLFDDPAIREKLVFLDGHDSDAMLVKVDSVALYLKRELRYPAANNLRPGNIRAFPFGVYQFHLDHLDDNDWERRDIDVSFVAFGGSNPMRQECAKVIRAAKESGRFAHVSVAVDQDKQPMPLPEYWRTMRSSKVIVSMPGAGLDTLRYWEAMGFGAVLASYDVSRQMVVPHAPEPMKHAVLFDNYGAFVEQVAAIVSDEARWWSMRRAADRLIRCHHTTTRRAAQMIDMFCDVTGTPFSTDWQTASAMRDLKASRTPTS